MKSYPKLRGRILEKYGSQYLFCKAVDKSETTVNKKLNGKSEFTKNDIIDWCNALEIDKDSVGDYFFAEKLSKS